MSAKRQIVDELHKPARKHFKRRRVIVKGLYDLYMADLVEMIPYAKVNKGFRYILVMIDTFSKYVWACPVKRKTGQEVAKAMKQLLSLSKRCPRNLQTDMGKEFYNTHFQDLMRNLNINHYSTFSNLKASMAERVNRTLKNIMWKDFSMQGSYKWLQILPNIIKQYNATKHRTTGYRPIDVNEKNEKQILQSAYSFRKTVDPKGFKFNVNDYVRISKYRSEFSKGYTPQWSTEIFKIKNVHLTNPTTYTLEDGSNQVIKGKFYTYELQRVKYPDVYLVEKVLRKKGDQVFVKWLGFDSKHNSWIPKSSIV